MKHQLHMSRAIMIVGALCSITGLVGLCAYAYFEEYPAAYAIVTALATEEDIIFCMLRYLLVGIPLIIIGEEARKYVMDKMYQAEEDKKKEEEKKLERMYNSRYDH